MEKETFIKVNVFGGISIVGGFIANLFGGWSSDLVTLLLFMGVDFITGLLIAGVFKKSNKTKDGALESKAGWKGLCKKGTTLLFVLVAHRLDLALGMDYIRTTVIIGFVINETISLVENAGIMGLPLPTALTKAIEVLKSKEV